MSIGGLFSPFFNSVWDKKLQSELAYDIFQQEQRLQRQECTKRNVHDPLPAPPPQINFINKSEIQLTRRRTASERRPSPPPMRHRLSANNLDDTSPYAEFSAETKALMKANSAGNELGVPLTSTPNVLSNHVTPGVKGATPLNPDRRSRGNMEDIYAEVGY